MRIHILYGTTGNHERAYDLNVTYNDGKTLRATFKDFTGKTKRVSAVWSKWSNINGDVVDALDVKGELSHISWIEH